LPRGAGRSGPRQRRKSRFLATASHDLRQPLQALQLLNAALQEQTSEPSTRELLTREREALDAMARLLNALLDISKLEAGSINPTSKRQRRGDSSRPCTGNSTPGPRPRPGAIGRSNPHYIKTDRTLFRQLLETSWPTASIHREGQRQFVLSASDQRLAITVADTGIGIAPEQLGSIFDEFYQVNRSRRQGVGLGLAIVKRNRGSPLTCRSRCQSQPGRGTQFQIGVPAARVASMNPIQSASATSAARVNRSPAPSFY